jgi:quinol monooxygenase YgiN
MTTRMTIMEALSDATVKQVCQHMDAYASTLVQEAGFLRSHRLSEEGGRMVVLETTWSTRESCVRHHASRAYRQLVAAINPYIVGDPVVKLFAFYSQTDNPIVPTTAVQS